MIDNCSYTWKALAAARLAVRKITTFTGGGLVGNVNPADKVPSNCYIIARVTNGNFVRLQDPPIGGPTHGFRCDKPFYYAS